MDTNLEVDEELAADVFVSEGYGGTEDLDPDGEENDAGRILRGPSLEEDSEVRVGEAKSIASNLAHDHEGNVTPGSSKFDQEPTRRKSTTAI